MFGVPVAGRRFISGKRSAEPDTYNPDRTIFDVEFEWTPTPAGDHIKSVLTNHRAVEQGLAMARVVMPHGNRAGGKGPNGWTVQSINDDRRGTAR